MKALRILPLLLIMTILLSSCGGASSNYWTDWVKDVPKGQFEQKDSESFVLERDGYSIEFTLDKWLATRGSSEYVLHPASDEIPLPLLQSSDCVIPFVLTAKTATKDNTFTTNFHLGVDALTYYTEYDNYASHHAYFSYACGLSQFEAKEEELTNYLDSLKPNNDKKLIEELMPQWHTQIWPQSFSGNFSETKLGDEQIILGCYVIKDYYSPEFPDGNLDLFPSDSAVMRVSIYFNSSGSDENFDVVMR